MSKIVTGIIKIDPDIYFPLSGRMMHVVKERGSDQWKDTVFRPYCGRWFKGFRATDYEVENSMRCLRCEAKVDFDEVFRQRVERHEQRVLQQRIKDLERGAERARLNALSEWDRVCTMIGWQIDEIASEVSLEGDLGTFISVSSGPRYTEVTLRFDNG